MCVYGQSVFISCELLSSRSNCNSSSRHEQAWQLVI